MNRRLAGLLAALPLLLGAGCSSGPYYWGGPTSDDPHGVVSPGHDITIWKVDGNPTTSHAFSILVAPGRRVLTLRVEFPIESDSPEPFEYRTFLLAVEDGYYYELNRLESQFPPYEVQVDERRFR